MNQQPEKRQISSPRFPRNNKDQQIYTFQQEQSKWRKKAWTQEEDEFLTKLVAKHGAQKWTLIAESLPGRIGKQCRERWHNHLNPDINKNEWTQKQQWILFLLHKNMGNQWAQFTKHLRGRTDNSIKNHWNSIMKKRASQYLDRYKRIKINLEASKESGDTDIDAYLLRQLENQYVHQQIQKWEKNDQKIVSKQDLPIKSMATVVKKQSFQHYFDHQKTAKKKTKNQTLQKKQETAVKEKKANQFNFNLNLNSRLSQLSVFGAQSKPNIVSAFSLLEQGQPIVLEPQPSFNDFSLSIQCFEEQRQQNQESSQKKRRQDKQFNSLRMSSKQSFDLRNVSMQESQ